MDHRERQSPVRDQGNRPTCAAFATTAAHEWMTGEQPDLSEEWALWAAKARDGIPGEATTVEAVLGGIESEGHALSGDWPYGAPAWPAPPPDGALHATTKRSPGDWARLPSVQLSAIRDELAQGSAVILSLRFVPAAWFQTNAGWIEAPATAVTVDGHAVLAVGIMDEPSSKGIIIKNSWGDGWAAKGYGYLRESYVDNFGICAHALQPVASGTR